MRSRTESWRSRFAGNAIALMIMAAACGDTAAAQSTRPGAGQAASIDLAGLLKAPLYWHLDTFSSRDEAQAAMAERSAIVEAFDEVWLFTIAESDWRASGGTRVARLGPLELRPGGSSTVSFLQTAPVPGFRADVHQDDGRELVYTVEAELCLETPAATPAGEARGPSAPTEGRQPMQPAGAGTRIRSSIVLVDHDTSRRRNGAAEGWAPGRLVGAT